MKNFPIEDPKTGKTWWISRAMAVVGIIVLYKKDEEGSISFANPSFLLSKRGPGCPDYIGKWQCTCGYLDFDETLLEALRREIYEELGLDINSPRLTKHGIPDLFQITDHPKHDPRQNVCFRFLIYLDYDEVKSMLEDGTIKAAGEERGGEGNEVSEIAIISEEDLKKMNPSDFAFNHYEILNNFCNGYIFDHPFISGGERKYQED